MRLEMIALEIHICDQRRSYVATFATEDQALTFMDRKAATHAFHELEDQHVPRSADRLLDRLYPTCEHGLSADLCSGPNHYGEPGDPGFN